MRVIRHWRIISTFLLAVLYVGEVYSIDNKLIIQKGVLDLRGEAFEEFTEITFTGEWEFYWEQLLMAESFKEGYSPELTCYENVPSQWNSIKVNGEYLPAHGYATYRLQVLTDTTGLKLAIRIGSISSSCKVFADGKLLFSGGTVSSIKNKGIPGYNPGIKLFENTTKKFDVIIQVSNYHYAKGGVWNNINSIGKAESVLKSREKNQVISMLMLGCIVIIALYFLGIYLLNRNLKSALFFSLFCLDIGLRSIVIGDIFLMKLFPGLKWEILVTLEYLTMPVGTLFFLLFFHSMFSYGAKIIRNVLITVNVVLVLAILILRVNAFTAVLGVYQVSMLSAGVYTVYLVILGLKKREVVAKIISIALLVFIIAAVNDILYVNKVVNTAFLTTYGFMFFIFVQAYMLAFRFLRMYKKTNELAQRLETINMGLEKTVEQRTQEIQQQNRVLQEQNNEIIEQRDEIITQRDNIELRNRALNEQKQVITDSINYAHKIQRAILPSRNILSKYLKEHFIYYKPKDIVSGDFYWFTVKQDKIFIVAADCTGHGVPGAFMSVLGMAYLTEICRLEEVDSTAEILEHLREKVKQSLRQYDASSLQKEGIDMAICIYDPSTGILEYSGAYNPLYLVRNNELKIYKGDRQPVSVHMQERPFTSTQIKVEKDDVFYIFSDGYSDQFGGMDRQKFRIKNFQRLLLEIHKLPLKEQKLVLSDKMVNWMGNNPQIDDILVMGFKFN